MRSTVALFTLMCLLLGAVPAKAEALRPAKDVLAAATKQAKAEHKPIFLHFGSSW